MEKGRRIVYVTIVVDGEKKAKTYYNDEFFLVSKPGDEHAKIHLISNRKVLGCRESHNEVLRQMNGEMKKV